MAIFVSQVVAKSQIHKIFKSQNLTDFLRFRPIFFLMWSQFIFLKAYTKFQGQTTIKSPWIESGHFVPPPAPPSRNFIQIRPDELKLLINSTEIKFILN